MHSHAGTLVISLLYPSAPAFPEAFADRLTARLARYGHRARDVGTSPDADSLAELRFLTFDLGIALQDAPDDGTLFDAALASGFASVRPSDYASCVADHGAVVRLVLTPTGHAGPAAKVLVAHLALIALVEAARPLAIHWGPTDTLFLPEEIPPVDPAGFPASLVLRPDIRSGGRDARGRRRHGFVAGFSEDWFGKPVVVEPTSLPLPETLAFVDLCLVARLQGDDLLSRNRVIDVREGLTVTVRHMPSGRIFRDGHVSLTFRQRDPEDRPRPILPRLPLPRMPAPAVPAMAVAQPVFSRPWGQRAESARPDA